MEHKIEVLEKNKEKESKITKLSNVQKTISKIELQWLKSLVSTFETSLILLTVMDQNIIFYAYQQVKKGHTYQQYVLVIGHIYKLA